MKTRAITAFFFTLIMLSSIFLGAYTFSAFYLLLSSLALVEFYKMVKIGGAKPHQLFGVLSAIILFSTTIYSLIFSFELKYALLIIPLLFLIFIAELYRKNTSPFSHISYTLIGLIYVTIPFCFFYGLGFLKEGTYSFHLPLAFLLMLWANDTGAYLFGMKLGKHKLFERHSPKKSWEGFFGGIFTGIVVAIILSYQFTEIQATIWVVMAIIISCFGTLGDLVESMLKRSLNVKDSGTFMPGHGGFLDRFDGLLISAPLVYVFLYWVIK